MKNYGRIVSKINSTPWLMTEDAIHSLLGILERHMSEDEDEIRRHIDLLDSNSGNNSDPQIVNGVGVLTLEGPIFPKANLMTELSGATSLEGFRNDFRGLLANDAVSSIVLNIDSPGGVSDLVMETAAEIRAARDVKPVISIANTMAASAALWLASAGSEFYITDSGLTGSLGAYMVHVDTSEKEKMEGIKKTVIQAGNAKGAGEQALNEYSRTNLQAMIDDTYKDFVESVAANRNSSVEEVMAYADGGVMTPRQALEVGLVDGIKTFDNVMAELTQNGGFIGNQSAALTIKALARKGMISGSDYERLMHEPDLGHGDPGPSGEPIPRESPVEDDKAVKGGWRVPGNLQPSFPSSSGQPPPVSKGKTKGSAMDRTQLVALAQRLGIDHDDTTTEDDLWAFITSEVDDIVVPLTQASAAADKRKSFATDYPDEYERYRKLLERDEENEARAFASRWERFEIEENGTTRKSTNGFSGRVIGHIENVHLALSRRQLTEEDLSKLLDAVGAGGVVDYGEHGSSRDVAVRPTLQTMNVKETRQLFADEVARIMEEDGVDRKAAIRIVGEQNPDLAEAYKVGHVRGG